MAAKTRKKSGTKAQRTVKGAMHKFKRGTLKSGPGGKGGKVKSRRQAIAIGLSEARRKGASVPAAKKRGGGKKKKKSSTRRRR